MAEPNDHGKSGASFLFVGETISQIRYFGVYRRVNHGADRLT